MIQISYSHILILFGVIRSFFLDINLIQYNCDLFIYNRRYYKYPKYVLKNKDTNFLDTAVYHYNGDYKKICDKFKKLRKDVYVHTLRYSYLSNIHHMFSTHQSTPEDDEITNKNSHIFQSLIHEQYPLAIQNLFCIRVLLNTFMTNIVAFNVQEDISDNNKDIKDSKDNKLKTHTFILILGKNTGKKPGEDLFSHGFMYDKYKIFLNANIQKEIVNVYKMEGNQFHLMKKINSIPLLGSESYKGAAGTTIKYAFVPVKQTKSITTLAETNISNRPKVIPYSLSFDPTNYVLNEHYNNNLYNINSDTLHPVELFNAFEILKNEEESIKASTFFTLRPFYKQNVQLFAHRSYVYSNPYDYYYRRVCNTTEQTVNAFDKLLSSSKYGKRYMEYKKHSIMIKNKRIFYNHIFQPFIIDICNLIFPIVVKDEYVKHVISYEEFMEIMNLSYTVQILFYQRIHLTQKKEFKPTLFTTLCHRNEHGSKMLKYANYLYMKNFLHNLPKYQWIKNGLVTRKYINYLKEDKHKYHTRIKPNKRKIVITNNHEIITYYEVEKFKEKDRKSEIFFICAVIITSIMLFIVVYLFVYLRIKLNEKKRQIKINMEVVDEDNGVVLQ